jgi:hypothetical protein
MPKLLLTGISQPWSFELKLGLNRLGRNATNDICLSDGSISSYHCELIVSVDSIVTRDLGSTNGTFINGVAIREAVLLPGQTLMLGTAELRLDAITENYAEARVAIPDITPETPRTHDTLADGAPACVNHSEIHAAFQCTKCAETFCDECVHKVGLKGGNPMFFCPICSAACEPLASSKRGGRTKQKRRHKSMLGRLTETLKLPFQRRRGGS